MPATNAQIAANRRNSALSTGPKTTAGKQRSRRNAFKHGLTGDGVALPDEDLVEVTSRFLDLEAELQPSGTSSRILLRRFAYLSVRLERCERLDTAVYSKRIRHAEEEFIDHRLTQVEELATRLAHDPMTAARRLQATPEGIDCLIRQWAELRVDLMHRERDLWTLNHFFRMERLRGIPEANYRSSRPHALTQALQGFSNNIDPSAIEGLSELEQIEWARAELAKIIDDEVCRLEGVKEGLDPAAIDQDRLEASARCLFDLQPAMNQVRKYEAATERSMYKALNEFRALEVRLKETLTQDEMDVNPEELASFEPEDEIEETVFLTPPRFQSQIPSIPENVHFTRTRSLDEAHRSAEQLEKALC
jgi:hypothetical protein